MKVDADAGRKARPPALDPPRRDGEVAPPDAGAGMKAAEFDYIRADSVAAACQALAAAEPGEEHKIIAGGQTLVPLMAMRLARPALLVDIDGIPGLDGIESRNGILAVGAMTRQRAAELSPAIRGNVPLLAKALRFVGHLQTRNRGTVGGSLAHGDPAAEIPLAAVTLDAELEAEGTGGRRVCPANGFFEAPMVTAIAPDECLVEARFPVWDGERIGTGFQEVASRQGDFAIVAAAAQVALDGEGRCTRIAAGLGGVAPQAGQDRGAGGRTRGNPAGRQRDRSGRSPRSRRRSTPTTICTRPPPIAAASRRCCSAARSARHGTRPRHEPGHRGHGQRRGSPRQRDAAHDVGRSAARHPWAHRHPYRLRARGVRRVLDPARRRAGPLMPDLRGPGRRPRGHHGGGAGQRAGRDRRPPGRVLGVPRDAVRLLHARDADCRPRAAGGEPGARHRGDPRSDIRQSVPLHRLHPDRRGDRALRRGSAAGRTRLDRSRARLELPLRLAQAPAPRRTGASSPARGASRRMSRCRG